MDRLDVIVEYIISNLFSKKDNIEIDEVIKSLLRKGFDLNEISSALIWVSTSNEYEVPLYSYNERSFRFFTFKEKNYFEKDALSKLVELYGNKEINSVQLEMVMDIVETRQNETDEKITKDELMYIVDKMFYKTSNNIILNENEIIEIPKKRMH